MRDFLKMISVLFIVCGLAAGSLAVVDLVTKARIALWERKQRDAALKVVFPAADEFLEVSAGKAWEARAQGQKCGDAFLLQIRGYSGPIAVMFGVATDGTVTGLQVLSHTETPGLGAKIATAKFRDQFKGKLLEQLKLKKDDPQAGQIDTVTGATISSRAVTRALYEKRDFYRKGTDGGGK